MASHTAIATKRLGTHAYVIPDLYNASSSWDQVHSAISEKNIDIALR
jgi:hypothetical protein